MSGQSVLVGDADWLVGSEGEGPDGGEGGVSEAGRLHGEQSVLRSACLLASGGSLRCSRLTTWGRR